MGINKVFSIDVNAKVYRFSTKIAECKNERWWWRASLHQVMKTIFTTFINNITSVFNLYMISNGLRMTNHDLRIHLKIWNTPTAICCWYFLGKTTFTIKQNCIDLRKTVEMLLQGIIITFQINSCVFNYNVNSREIFARARFT